MQIITWNVNGIRALASKGQLGWLLDSGADLLCLQEVKANQSQLGEPEQALLSGWHVYWNAAERPGYSGVATLARQAPEAVVLGMGDSRYDREGRIVVTQYDQLYVFNIYFPNGQRDHGRLTYKLDFYAELLKVVQGLINQGKQVVLCGDFNTAHQPIDLKNAKQNEHTSGFLLEERAWIDQYISAGFVDIYRALYPDRIQYTWWTYIGNARARNVGWRLDYYLVTQDVASRVSDVIIHDDVAGSDHCPVSLFIDTEKLL